MFITLTIDTHAKKNTSKIKMKKRAVSPIKGWHRPLQLKKRSLIKRFKDWRKNMKSMQYRLDGRTMML